MTMFSDNEYDDDSSMTSTVSVHRVSLHQKETACSTNATTSSNNKKSVHFDEARNESYGNTLFCKEDTLDLWYTTEDHTRFKAANNDLAKEIMRSERGNNHHSTVYSYQRVMQRVYDACCLVEQEQQAAYDGSEDDASCCSLLSSDESKHLQQWLNCATSRIGLERKSVRSIARDRHYRRKAIYNLVLEMGTMTLPLLQDNNDAKTESLCQACQALSRPSRLFAHQLALAQAAANGPC
jgi:hypothetical protein